MAPAADKAGERNPPAALRRVEELLFLPSALGTLLFSIRVVGPKLTLIYFYGWDKVQQRHLHVLQMRKHDPWLVSNGDLIIEGRFVHYLISGGCWLALFLATYPLIRLLLPRKGIGPNTGTRLVPN